MHARRVFEQPFGAEVGPRSFDWRKFKIPPHDAEAINPMHLHVLEAGAQALEATKAIPHATTGVFIGGTGLGWRRDAGMRIRLQEFLDAADRAAESAGLSERTRQDLLAKTRITIEQRLRPVSDDGVVNSLASIAAGRLAMRFDLRGPHAGIDAGFASGLAAIADAVQLLRDNTIDLAVAGGASESITPLDLLAFSQLAVLARRNVRPFDAEAEGTLLGEGVALFALKRLEDALEQGERIWAVIRGIGASSDGRSSSLLAPSVDGQSLAMHRAYADAKLEPSTVGFVECHATGTAVGDASEIRALARVFGGTDRGSIAVGSAKPFIGHLRGASGAVGLLRAVLALHHRTIPAQIGFAKPHPNLELDATPFFIPVEQLPLEPRGGAPSARAAVSSFGLGGNNYHAVLEAWTPEAQSVASHRVATSSDPIAIVGLGGVLPGASSVPDFWRALNEGRDATREVPATRFSIHRYYDPDHNRLEKSYTRIGCFVDPVPDPGKQLRIPPAARIQIDPGQILAFCAAEEAITDSQLEAMAWDRNRTAVVLGFLGCQGRRFLAEVRLNFLEFLAELEQSLSAAGIGNDQIHTVLAECERLALADVPPITEDTLPGYLGSINAARIARRFDLHGPHFVVDSACASSLAALHTAVRLLRQGEVDTVLLGGVWADGQPEFFVQNCRFSALSADAITPFDERASGFVPGEGAAILVLRRLADAERDGQRVQAIVRSVEGSSDGGAGRSIYSPSPDGESLAMERALKAAKVSPEDVDYIECHGTGTALGDVVEIQSCTRAYGTGRNRPLLVGSVKSNIGHLMAGAGAAALLKTTLAIRDGIIPPSLKVQSLNPKIDFASAPVEVVTQTKQWECPDGRPRRAGVSAFGLGGTNFHAILEEHQPAVVQRITSVNTPRASETPHRILPIATASGGDLVSCAKALATLAADLQQSSAEKYWRTLESTHRAGTDERLCRVAVVAREPELLVQKARLLESTLARGRDPSFLRAQGIFASTIERDARVAAVFPGQGPQYPNMLRSAASAFPELTASLDRMDRAYEAICGKRLRPSFFTDDTESYRQSDEDIHCAVFAVNVALFELLLHYGARFDAVMGQSAGELSALVAAGSISVEDGLRAVRERTLAVLAVRADDPGRMVALSCGAERALELMHGLPGYSALAADNGPTACIVSGDRAAIEALLSHAADAGLQASVLPVSHGYHSQLIAAARPRYREVLDSIRFGRPTMRLFSTVTGNALDTLPIKHYPAHLESQFVEPVRLRQATTALYQSGVRLFVECGPKWPLSTFISEILAGRPHVAQATIHPKVGEVEQLHRALACLFVHRACSLHPVRELPMSASGSSISSASSAEPRQACAVGNVAIENQPLREVLQNIRALVDVALGRLETDAQSPECTTAEAGRDPSSPCLPPLDEEPRSGPGISSPLSSDVVQVAQASQSQPIPRVDSTAQAGIRQNVHARLVAELVQRTGYPEDTLDVDLDLEAELGIDTVKQVAALAAVRAHLDLQPDPKFRMQDARTIRKAVDYLVARVSGAASLSTICADSDFPRLTSANPSAEDRVGEGGAIADRLPDTVMAQAVELSAPTSDDTGKSPIWDQVRSLLIAELVSRTGYPEDTLDLNLDLEAELGIDTVKQVAALASTREHFGLPPDPNFRMQDARTLQQAVDYLVSRIQGKKAGNAVPCSQTSAAGLAPSPVPVSDILRTEVTNEGANNVTFHESDGTPRAPLGHGTALPAMSSELRESVHIRQAQSEHGSALPALSSALNRLQDHLKTLSSLIDEELRSVSPQQNPAEVVEPEKHPSLQPNASRSVYPEMLLASILPQAGCPWAGEVLEVTDLAVVDADSALPPTTASIGDGLSLHARAPDGQIVARSRRVRASNAGSSAPPSMLDAVKEAQGDSNDVLLRDYLEKSGRTGSSTIEWARSQGFTMTVGGAHVPNDCASPSRVMLSLLGSAYDVTSLAWFGFAGTLHALSTIDRLAFYRVPAPGEEILICARTARPESGFWRADVAVFDRKGELFAEFSGLEGVPIPRLGANTEHGSSDPANRAWRRFAQRLGRAPGAPEDIAS